MACSTPYSPLPATACNTSQVSHPSPAPSALYVPCMAFDYASRNPPGFGFLTPWLCGMAPSFLGCGSLHPWLLKAIPPVWQPLRWQWCWPCCCATGWRLASSFTTVYSVPLAPWHIWHPPYKMVANPPYEPYSGSTSGCHLSRRDTPFVTPLFVVVETASR